MGYVTDSAEVEKRARQLLDESGIDRASYKYLSAITRLGSQAELWFLDSDVMNQARLAIRALRKSCVKDREAWLDVKKSHAELKPARLVDRIHDVLSEYEQTKPEPKRVVKNMAGTNVEVDGCRAGASRHGRWIWYKEAGKLYSDEQLAHATEWAKSE